MTLSEKLLKRLTPLSELIPETQFWTIKLDEITEEEVTSCLPYLSITEITRMNSFHRSLDRSKYAVCRTLYKKVLADQLQFPIEAIRFLYTTKGKPYLEASDFYFNLSRSEETAIVAVGRYPVGVDIEFIDTGIDVRNIMHLFLSNNEISWMLQCDVYRRFFRLWTLKEAILKCTGEGITVPRFPELSLAGNEWHYPDFLLHTFCFLPGYIFSVSLGYKGTKNGDGSII